MALSNEIIETKSDFGTLLTIVGGQWTVRVTEGTEGAIERKLTKGENKGKSVWELKYPTVTGYLKSCEFRESDYGTNVDLKLTDENGDSFTVEFPLDNMLLKELIKRLPNVDRTKQVSLQLAPSKKKKTRSGNPVTTISLIQDGKRAPDYFVKWEKVDGKNVPQHINGFPEPKKARGKWDWSECDNFLYDTLEDYFNDDAKPDDPEEKTEGDYEDVLPY